MLPPLSLSSRRDRHRGLRVCGVAALLAAVASAAFAGSASAARPSFEAAPTDDAMTPSYRADRHDYSVRCGSAADRLEIDGASGWRSRINSGGFRGGDRTVRLRQRSARGTRITFRNESSGARSSYHVRCLPRTFPEYSFNRIAPGGPELFSMQLGYRWAAIFDRNGAAVWWYRASGEPDNVQVLSDGTITFDPVDQADFQTGDHEIRTIRGRLLRVIRGAAGAVADIHEVLLMPNGNYLIGAQSVHQEDASAFGGSADSSIIGIEIQEVTPDGELVSNWKSRDHIGLEETGRWWNVPILDNEPYDTTHWNSAELVGKNRMMLSFRHLDAVYMVNRRSGEIVWKLGGTETPESLEILDDPFGDYPLGGNHDARILPDGSITIYDNRTGLGDPPRAVRYRIDEDAGTARLVETITDPEIASSFCCGSARRLDSGDWLIGWGGDSTTAAYDRDGNPLYKLKLGLGFSYRSIPVPEGVVSKRQLRNAMDAMAKR